MINNEEKGGVLSKNHKLFKKRKNENKMKPLNGSKTWKKTENPIVCCK